MLREIVRATLFLILGTSLGITPAAGQLPVRRPVPSVLFSSPARMPLGIAAANVPADTLERDIRPTHWKEGAFVGGLLGGGGGGLLSAALCRSSEQAGKDCTGSTVSGFLVGALVLGLPGALIGGQIPKGGVVP